MRHLTAVKFVSLSFFNWIKNEMNFFLSYSELMLPTLIQRYDKNHFNFDPFQKQESNWNFTSYQMPHFMIVLIPYINLLDLSRIKKI